MIRKARGLSLRSKRIIRKHWRLYLVSLVSVMILMGQGFIFSNFLLRTPEYYESYSTVTAFSIWAVGFAGGILGLVIISALTGFGERAKLVNPESMLWKYWDGLFFSGGTIGSNRDKTIQFTLQPVLAGAIGYPLYLQIYDFFHPRLTDGFLFQMFIVLGLGTLILTFALVSVMVISLFTRWAKVNKLGSGQISAKRAQHLQQKKARAFKEKQEKHLSKTQKLEQDFIKAAEALHEHRGVGVLESAIAASEMMESIGRKKQGRGEKLRKLV